MPLSSIELCSSALVKLGANGISSFEDGTAEVRVAASLYPIIRDALLCAHPSFATAKTRLARLSVEPLADHLHAFQLPQNFLKALSAGSEVRARGLSYQIVNRQLHTDATEVVLTYLFRPSEGDFPAYFSVALVSRLSAEFCIPVTENTSRAERLARLADEEMKLARLIDSQQDTPPRVEDFTLIEARWS
jgi:hypothetical protein